MLAESMTGGAPAAQVFHVDPAQSVVTFTLGDVLHKVKGTFHIERGEIRVDETGAAAGEIVVDARTGQTGIAARDRRMNDDVLESGRFPEIRFAPSRLDGRLAAAGVSKADVEGQFTIHGQIHPLVAGVVLTRNGAGFEATVDFPVPYVRWGMRNPSALMLRVKDTVQIELVLKGSVAER